MLFDENVRGRDQRRQVPELTAFTVAQLVQLLGMKKVFKIKSNYFQVDKCVQNPHTVSGRYRGGAANEKVQGTPRQDPLVFAFFTGVA